MKYFELDTTEKKLLKDFELGKVKSIKNVAKKKVLYQTYLTSLVHKHLRVR